MKKLILFMMIIPFISFGYDTKDVVGKWEYLDLGGKEDLDEKMVPMLENMFNSVSIVFQKDGRYRLVLMGKEELGSFEVKESTIHLETDKGVKKDLKILALEKKKLEINLQRTHIVLFSVDMTDDDKVPPASKNKKLEVERKKLVNEWNCIGMDDPGIKDQKKKEMMNDKAKGGKLILKENGDYDIDLLGMTEKGIWKLNESKDKLNFNVPDGNSKSTWKIVALSDDKMTLSQETGNKKYYFEAK